MLQSFGHYSQSKLLGWCDAVTSAFKTIPPKNKMRAIHQINELRGTFTSSVAAHSNERLLPFILEDESPLESRWWIQFTSALCACFFVVVFVFYCSTTALAHVNTLISAPEGSLHGSFQSEFQCSSNYYG